MLVAGVISIILAANSVLAISVFLRRPNAKLNRYFSAFVGTTCLWIAANFLENQPHLVGRHAIDFFLQLDIGAAILACYLWLRTITILTDNTFELNSWSKHRLALIATVVALAFLAFFQGPLIANISFGDDVIAFSGGPLWIIYVLIIGTMISVSIFMLIQEMLRARNADEELQYRQYKFILIGATLSFGTALAVNLPQAFFRVSLETSQLGIFGMVFLVITTSYAILRLSMFEMKIALLRSMSSIALVLVMVGSIVFVLFYAADQVYAVDIDKTLLITGLIFGTAAAVAFAPLRQKLERATENMFHIGHRDSELIMKRISRALIETADKEIIAKRVLEEICSDMLLSGAAIIYRSNTKSLWWHGEGSLEKIPEIFQKTEFYDMLCFATHIFDDLKPGKIKDIFREFEYSGAFPLYANQRCIGAFITGMKLSGEALASEDVTILEAIAGELAVGIANAETYEEMRLLNTTLEQRVAERTSLLELSRKEELARAQEVTKLKDEFFFVATHELRTPITAIRGFIELTESSGEKFSDEIQQNFKAIRIASAHMNQMVNELLEIARSESGKMNVVVVPHEFQPILEDALFGLSSLVEEKSLTLEFHAATMPMVLCDPPRLKEVLINLVSNAIKYNRVGGRIDIFAGRSSTEPGRMIFEIHDTGFGIPEAEQGKVFQKFFRANTKGTETVTGTGLGLFITRMLIERMGGELSFSSIEGYGTTFTFTLKFSTE